MTSKLALEGGNPIRNRPLPEGWPGGWLIGEEEKKEVREKCLALVYQGENAITKIRKVLGETNPKEAAPGTVRKDFGLDIIKNGAHASDSSLSAEREMKIIQIEKDDIPEIVEKHYGRI